MRPADNPLLHETGMQWLQRLRRMRADPAESAVTAAGIFALLVLALWVASSGLSEWGGWLLAQLDRSSIADFLLLLILDGLAVQRFAVMRLHLWRHGWLAPHTGRRHRRQALVMQLALRSLLLLAGAAGLIVACRLCDASAHWPHPLSIAAIAAALVLSPLTVFIGRLPRLSQGAAPRTVSRTAVQRSGSIAVWQFAAIGLSWRSRTLAWVFSPVLLLFPAGEGLRNTLGVLVLGLLLALLLVLWNRSMDVLLRATQWLRAQPISTSSLLGASLRLPLTALLFAALLFAAGTLALHLPLAASLILAAGIVLLGLLHAGCVCAWRYAPRRIGPTFTAQLVVLAATLQALPPTAPVLALALLIWLTFRALRA